MGPPRDLTSLMQIKDPADSSHEMMATILYVAKNSSTGESSLAML